MKILIKKLTNILHFKIDNSPTIGTNKMINQLNSLFEILTFKAISSSNNDDFKKIILNFFSEVNNLKDEGLILNEDLKTFIDHKHIEYDDEYEKSPVFEERIQMILSELVEFCSPPKFWQAPFKDYMLQKWGITIT